MKNLRKAILIVVRFDILVQTILVTLFPFAVTFSNSSLREIVVHKLPCMTCNGKYNYYYFLSGYRLKPM